MEQTEIKQKVKEIVALHFDIRLDDVDLSHNFQQDYNTDSLDTIEIVMALEDRFGLDIKDEDAENLITVGAVVDFIQRRLNEDRSSQ